jgi:hypothetical protein
MITGLAFLSKQELLAQRDSLELVGNLSRLLDPLLTQPAGRHYSAGPPKTSCYHLPFADRMRHRCERGCLSKDKTDER